MRYWVIFQDVVGSMWVLFCNTLFLGVLKMQMSKHRTEIWRVIRHAMIDRGIDTLSELAAIAEISKPTLISIMQGKSCHKSNLESIACALEMDVKELMVK